ncbi:sugar MFS transporter [Agromyces sp. LHK192]|uniref:MFS transporter n=1 Tax=Agromyces sp. LHK192 TaxID=2498704 RepID=UPI000FDBA213|nr:MFS transporter [Agromyces sp. LHK192]
MAQPASPDSVDDVRDTTGPSDAAAPEPNGGERGVGERGAGHASGAHGGSRSPRELRAWRNAVFAVFFLSGLSMATWVARLPTLRDAVDLTTQGVGLVILTGSLASVVGLVVAPLVLARVGPRASMVAMLLVVAVGIALVGVGGSLVPSLPIIVIGLMLAGLGNGAVDVVMNVDAAEVERELGRTVMPLMHAFFSFGTVAGAGLAAGASGLGVPVAPHFAVVGAIIAGGVLLAGRFIPHRAAYGEPDSAHGAAAGRRRTGWAQRLRSNLAVWADLRLIAIGVVMLAMSFAEGSANDWIAIAVVDGHEFDETTAATVFTVFTISMTAARVLGGPILDRFGRVPVIRTEAIVGVAGLALFIFGTELWMLVLGVVLWGIGASLGFPVGMSAAADVPDRAQAAARVSAVAMIGYTAFLVGPPLLGLIGEHLGILTALCVLLGLMVVAVAMAPAVRERSGTRGARHD